MVVRFKKLRAEELQRVDDWLESHRGRGMICHTQAVTIYFPVPTAPQLEAFEGLLKTISGLFGGATVTDGEGIGCGDDDCTYLEREQVKVIHAAHSCDSEADRQRFAKALTDAMVNTKQSFLGIRGTNSWYGIPVKELNP